MEAAERENGPEWPADDHDHDDGEGDSRALQDPDALLSVSPQEFWTETFHQLYLGLPMVGMYLLDYSVLLVCLIFAGHVSSQALAGTSLGSSLANVAVFSLLDGLSSAMEPLCGQARGAKDFVHMGKLVQRVHAILSLICMPMACILFFTKPILMAFHQDQNVSSLAQQFTRCLIPSLFFVSATVPLSKLLEVNELSIPLSIISAISLLLHVAINWLLVIVVQVGVMGTSISISITHFFKLVLLLLYLRFFDSKQLISLCWSNGFSFRFAFTHWKEFFDIGLPACAMICLEWWFFEIILVISGSLPNPESSIDAITIFFQIEALTYMLSLGMSIALSVRVSNELGARNIKSAKKAIKVGSILSILLGAILCVLLLLFGKSCTLLFTKGKDDPAIPILLPLIPSLAILKLFSIPGAVLLGALRGSGMVFTGALVNGICYYFVGIPLASLLAFWPGYLGVHGLWISVMTSLILQCFVISVIFYRIDWSSQISVESGNIKDLSIDELNETEKDSLIQNSDLNNDILL